MTEETGLNGVLMISGPPIPLGLVYVRFLLILINLPLYDFHFLCQTLLRLTEIESTFS